MLLSRKRTTMLSMIVAAVPAFSLGEPELPGQSDSLPSDIEPPLLSAVLEKHHGHRAAAGLSIQDPRERPVDKQQAAETDHRCALHFSLLFSAGRMHEDVKHITDAHDKSPH
jgi:hypothetical protein